MEQKQRHALSVPLLLAALVAALALLLSAGAADAFCGFYVATGDMRIYNRASKVVLARDGDRTVLTMSSDFRGDPKQFAVVVPVPVVLQKGQVHIGDSTAVTHLDDYSVPRLVEYTDPNPCPEVKLSAARLGGVEVAMNKMMMIRKGSATRQVVVEAQYKVDEYDIQILSAKEGQALGEWLRANGYSMPPGAAKVLSSYIKQGMYFFVAKVDLAEQQRLGYSYLRPIQVAFESPKFVLPLRLGMVNADGPQDMLVFTLTRKGRVESTNYRTVRMPTDIDVPEFVKREFTRFYPQLFDTYRRSQGEDVVFVEYAWVLTPSLPNCDPCTAPVLSPQELRGLGTSWIASDNRPPREVFLTRMHVRYDAQHFPEDLVLHETGDRENWQARYVIHHPYPGNEECAQRSPYLKTVWARRAKEAANYASLTGTDERTVRKMMDVRDDWSYGDETLSWWDRIWR